MSDAVNIINETTVVQLGGSLTNSNRVKFGYDQLVSGEVTWGIVLNARCGDVQS